MSTENGERSERTYRANYQEKLAVHERDRYRCIGCRERFQEPSDVDVDHVIPVGKGGANTVRNKATECRRCHEAKHGERDHAPTVRFMSTGDMIDKDFRWFRHWWKQQLPALSEVALNHRIQPVFNIADSTPYQAWHISLGDLRRLDELLSKRDDIEYASLRAADYM